MTDYQKFLEAKLQFGAPHGFDPVWLPDFLFDFQRALVEWAVRNLRAASRDVRDDAPTLFDSAPAADAGLD